MSGVTLYFAPRCRSRAFFMRASAAAFDAFLAIDRRSAAVKFSARVFPPIRPSSLNMFLAAGVSFIFVVRLPPGSYLMYPIYAIGVRCRNHFHWSYIDVLIDNVFGKD